ncbi:MAG: Neurochondrin-domain-containing protein [Podila humilis]|nr:MAG: Neurochondrin-domain-containing protein [Podila humilis]
MASTQEQDTIPTSDLERCLELLKPGTPDESKFVGLTLMTTFLQTKQQDKDREAIITQFFDSMDFDFLDRMLQIDDSTVPKDAGVDSLTIKAIAVDIMTCFSSVWQLLVRKEFKDRVPVMINILSTSDTTESSNNILKILVKMTAYPQVSMIFTNPGYQSAIVAYILCTFDKKDEAHEDATMIFKRTFLIIQEGFKQNPAVVLQITKDFMPTIMTKIAKSLSQLTEPHKPEIVRLLTESIAYLSEAYVQQHVKDQEQETKTWTKYLKSGLIQLLSTRQAPSTRDDCFKLTGILLQRLGPEWLFPDTSSSSSSSSSSTSSVTKPKKKPTPASLVNSMESLSLSEVEINKKFAALIVHLTCVEARVLMDELADDLSGDPNKDRSDDTDHKTQAQAKIRKEQVLPLAYEILEVTIGYLVHVSESEDEMENGLFDATGLLKVQESLQATFAAILDYLKDLQASSTSTPATLATNLIYLASIRILSVWLMEDDSLHGQTAALVPPLEAVVRHCKSKPSQKSLLKLLEPILDRFHEISFDD